ncbi:hypothetical protein AGMMS49992_17340 [Clostridia bacterium]|nr:hypothetical protein AGMMS49992_17340 [Clostridia bacterium]
MITKEELIQKFPVGTRIELTAPMDDPYPSVKVGDQGVVEGVDDFPNIEVKWDNGSGLSILPDVDSFKVIENISPKAFADLMKIRSSGVTNMFEFNTVQRIAFDEGYYELVTCMEGHKTEYGELILTG